MLFLHSDLGVPGGPSEERLNAALADEEGGRAEHGEEITKTNAVVNETSGRRDVRVLLRPCSGGGGVCLSDISDDVIGQSLLSFLGWWGRCQGDRQVTSCRQKSRC